MSGRMVVDRVLVAIVLALLSRDGSAQTLPSTDSSPHRVQFVAIDPEIRLEVLDWGGSGRPIVLLAGLGNTAHVFDELAPKLADIGHVYGVTRRGYGASARPGSGYSADRLGEDVLQVMNALSLESAVLVGHSIGGQELSYLASRHTDRVAGAIYLDAAYRYAYAPADAPAPDFSSLGPPPPPPSIPSPSPADRATPAAFRAWSLRFRGFALPDGEITQLRAPGSNQAAASGTSATDIERAIMAGEQRFTDIPVSALIFFASPHGMGPGLTSDPASQQALEAFAKFDRAMVEHQATAVERGLPRARVIRLTNASHYIFLSHERDVLTAMKEFIAALR